MESRQRGEREFVCVCVNSRSAGLRFQAVFALFDYSLIVVVIIRLSVYNLGTRNEAIAHTFLPRLTALSSHSCKSEHLGLLEKAAHTLSVDAHFPRCAQNDRARVEDRHALVIDARKARRAQDDWAQVDRHALALDTFESLGTEHSRALVEDRHALVIDARKARRAQDDWAQVDRHTLAIDARRAWRAQDDRAQVEDRHALAVDAGEALEKTQDESRAIELMNKRQSPGSPPHRFAVDDRALEALDQRNAALHRVLHCARRADAAIHAHGRARQTSEWVVARQRARAGAAGVGAAGQGAERRVEGVRDVYGDGRQEKSQGKGRGLGDHGVAVGVVTSARIQR